MSENMMSRFKTTLLALLLLAPALALASEGARLDHAPIDSHDLPSLQRGAQVFVNYCLNCHSASYMRYNRLRDIGLTEPQIRDNLVLTGAKVGDLMKISMDPKEAKQWFGTTPPDLTVIARSRSSPDGSGGDWLYTYLRSFYRDSARPTGWNNVVYPSVAMPHALYQLQGEQVMKEETVQGPGYPVVVEKLALAKPGTMTPVEYDRLVADLVNYMTYMSEPVRHERTTLGLFVLLVLGGIFVLVYALKKEFWKDVH